MQQDRNKYTCNGTECSETSAYKIQTPDIHPKKEYNFQNTAKI